MNQEITGSSGIGTEEAFGGGAGVHQLVIIGSHGIPSEEAFPPPAGVFIDPGSVPFSISISY